MSAAVLCVLLGIAWAQGRLSSVPSYTLFLLAAVFFGLYTAHLMDTYVDVVKRGDRTPANYPLLFRDSTGLIEDKHYPVLIATSVVLTVLFSAIATVNAGALVAVPLAIGLAIALAYAPLLDRKTVGVTFAYPAGVTCAAAAGYALAAGTLDLRFGALGLALFLALAGTKIRSDIIDVKDDLKITKCTVPVVAGERPALWLAYSVALAGILLAAALPVFFAVTPWFALPALGIAGAIALTARLDPFKGSMAMAGSLFVLIVAELVLLAIAG
jgi:4-hydroxybenzoate polyprenyltransferase